jgi:predicted pyridoxine 5'-phosphate oxidase superfamily flavin-nucleotide-binding protein
MGAAMDALYHAGHRGFQDRFDARRLADRIEARLVQDRLGAEEAAFVEARDMFFVATADAEGRPTCSYKGGDPGFVRVVDARTLAFPLYDGNGMFLSAGNLRVNPHVGLLFVDFASGRRLRVEGTASMEENDPLAGSWPGARLVVRVAVRHAYPNCTRYVHHLATLERSAYVPREGCEPPVPGWKRAEWARDVLPAGDPAASPPAERDTPTGSGGA